MQNPAANLYTAILAIIDEQMNEIRYASQDLGQIDFYDEKPPVSFPAALIDIDIPDFTDAGNACQLATANVTIRLAHTTYSDVSNLAPPDVRNLGLKLLDLEFKLRSLLHTWQPDLEDVGHLMCTSILTEKRDDNIRVRQLSFTTGIQYDANTIKPSKTPFQFLS